MANIYYENGGLSVVCDEAEASSDALFCTAGGDTTFLGGQPFDFKAFLKQNAATAGVRYILSFTLNGERYNYTLSSAVISAAGGYVWNGPSDMTLLPSMSNVKLYQETTVGSKTLSLTLKSFTMVEIPLEPTIDTSGAKTVYIRTSAADSSFDVTGAKFAVNGNTVAYSSYVTWDVPSCDPKVTGNYQITGSYSVKVTLYASEERYDARREYESECGSFTKALSASYTVSSKPLAIAGITINGTDTNNYWEDGSTTWMTPTYSSYVITYNNGSVVSFSPSDPKVTYWSDIKCTETLAGAKVPNDLTYANMRILTGDFVGNSIVYPLAINHARIDVTSVSATGTFTLGNTPKSQKDKIALTATYSDGASKAVTYGEEWYFASPDATYDDASKPLAVYVTNMGREYGTFDISKMITSSYPTVSSVSIIEGPRLSTSIVNGTSIDLTGTCLRVHYDGKDGYEDVPFADGNEAAPGRFTASCEALSGKVSLYDGTEDFDAELGEATSKDYSIALSGTDSIGNEISATLTVTVYLLTDILGLSLKTPKTDYKIGEEFLNASDTTKVRVWFSKGKDSNGYDIKAFIDMQLKSAFTSLAVHPAKGTKFASSGTVDVRVSSVFDTSKYVTYTITVEKAVKLSTDTTTLTYRFVKLASDWKYETEKGVCSLKSGTYVKLLESDTMTTTSGSSIKRMVVTSKELATSYKQDPERYALIHGYLDNVNDPDNNGVIVDFNDYVPPISGASNMTVYYPCYDEESSSFVDRCTFGVRFGHNNSLNRLFMSGNPDKPNYDIHSVEPNLTNEGEATSVSEGDFSYFPDEAMCRYGESENSIVGYDVVSDSKLLVLKDRSAKEKTIYFRVPIMVTMLDSSGTVMTDVSGTTLTQEEYSVYMGNSSVAGVSPNSIANFNGDTVFVDDDNEIAGLDVEGIVGDSQRQANSRSSRIDGKLRELDMSGANLETFGRYLILDIPGVAAFVADRESKNSSQYEWWRLDSLDSTCFMELDGVLYYGSSDGSLCRLSDGYSDRDVASVEVALGRLDYDNDLIVGYGDSDFMTDDGEYFWETFPEDDLYSSRIYARVLDCGDGGEGSFDTANNVIKVEDADLRKRINGSLRLYMTSFKEATAGIEALYGRELRLAESGDATGEYELLYADTYEAVDLSAFSEKGFRLCVRLDGEISARKSGEGEICLYDGQGNDAKQYDLVPYGGQSESFQIKGRLIRVTPISCRLVSAPLLISSANWFKHVIKLDISQGTADVSDIAVAYCNNRIPYVVEDSVKDRGQTIDLGAFSFSDVDFSSNFYTRTYTIGRELKCVKYICVAFASDRDMNSVVPSVSLTYTYSRLSRGVGE